jgi:uncharacterized protein YnzC (UPF0291/DUF896 family)
MGYCDRDECVEEQDELRAEIERLKDIIRSCVHGTEIVDIGGETIGLYLPNKKAEAA